MDKTFEVVLDAMPWDHKASSLQYNLLKRYISLQEFEDAKFGEVDAAAVLCSLKCSVKRKTEKCSRFGDVQAAAMLCSFRALPARYRPCSYCGLPEQDGPNRLDLQLPISEFERLLHKELEKIDNFFNPLYRQYIGTMKELDAMMSEEVSRQNRLRSEDSELFINPENDLEKIRQCIETTAAKMDLLASYCTLNRAAFIEILKKYYVETGSYIRGHFYDLLQKMDFVRDVGGVKRDVKFCLSLRGSSTVSSSSEAPRMSSRAKKIWRSQQQERLQLLSTSDENFNYIEAAKVAEDVIAAWSPKL